MLAKILEDMWVEPEILEALSEDQRRILFLKMREEQVRRWREREEKEEREDHVTNATRTKKVSSKHVSWLLGRDGDVSVSVIGDVSEFSSSKLLNSFLNNKLHSASRPMHDIQTGSRPMHDIQTGSRPMHDIQTGSRPMHDIQTGALLPEEASQHSPRTDDNSVTLNEPSSEEEMDTGCAEDDLGDPAEDSDGESGSNRSNLKDRPHLSSHGNEALKSQLSDTGRTHPQPKVDICCQEEEPSCRGRVAELRRAFASETSYTKPPVPAKPPHLQMLRAPSIH